jgi:hypothetical protein
VSMPQRYGLLVLSSRPAITGDTKYGPNLRAGVPHLHVHEYKSMCTQ